MLGPTSLRALLFITLQLRIIFEACVCEESNANGSSNEADIGRSPIVSAPRSGPVPVLCLGSLGSPDDSQVDGADN